MRALALALVLTGCGGAERIDDPSHTQSSEYEARIQARVDAGQQTTAHTLRLNPTDCRCPAFEIQLGDHWQRVDLAVADDQDPPLLALLAATEEAEDQVGRTYRVDGSLTGLIGRCGAGTAVVTFEPTAFEGVVVREPPGSAP